MTHIKVLKVWPVLDLFHCEAWGSALPTTSTSSLRRQHKSSAIECWANCRFVEEGLLIVLHAYFEEEFCSLFQILFLTPFAHISRVLFSWLLPHWPAEGTDRVPSGLRALPHRCFLRGASHVVGGTGWWTVAGGRPVWEREKRQSKWLSVVVVFIQYGTMCHFGSFLEGDHFSY